MGMLAICGEVSACNDPDPIPWLYADVVDFLLKTGFYVYYIHITIPLINMEVILFSQFLFG